MRENYIFIKLIFLCFYKVSTIIINIYKIYIICLSILFIKFLLETEFFYLRVYIIL